MDETIELIRTLVQQVQDAQEDFSEEELSQIFATLERAVKFVESKQAKPPAIPEVPDSPIESSNVNGMAFDAKSNKLFVQYHGPYPNARGSVYAYENVSPFLLNILKRGAVGPKTSGKNQYHEWFRGVSPSLGGSVNAILKKGNFPYQKVA